MATPSLSASTSSSLYALQRTQSAQDKNLQRLTTGRAVSSVSDNAQAFVLASGLLDRASSLSDAGTAIGQGVGAIQAANDGLTAISKVVTQLQSVAQQAAASTDTNQQSALQAQYNTLRSQIDSIAADSSYGGVNLIASNPSTLDVSTGNIQSTTVSGQAADSASLGITAASNWAGNTANIQSDLANLEKATTAIQTQASNLGGNLTSLQIQAQAVQGQAAIATQGANRLTEADTNESAASALSASTYRKMGLAALRAQTQSDSSVLALFSKR